MNDVAATKLSGAVHAWMDYTSRNRTSREVVFGIPRALVLRDTVSRSARRIRLCALFSQVFPVNEGTEPLSGMGLLNQVRANFDWHNAGSALAAAPSPLERLVMDALHNRLVSEDGVDGIQAALGTLLEDTADMEKEPDYSELTFGIRGEEYAGEAGDAGGAA